MVIEVCFLTRPNNSLNLQRVPRDVKVDQYILNSLGEKSVGTIELHYSTKKRHHVLSILTSFLPPTLVRV